MTGILDRIAKAGRAGAARKAGAAVAARWPFPVRATLRDGGAMWVDLRSAIGRAILVKGEFDPGVWTQIAQLLKPAGVFVDVGANIGYYTVLAASRVGPSGAVHAFEIDPRPLRCLARNCAVPDRQHVRVHRVAVSNRQGRLTLVMRPDSGHSAAQVSGSGPSVPCTTLDTWARGEALTRVDVMKLDIEGGELAALEGARDLIARFRPAIVCEALEAGHGEVPGFERLNRFFMEAEYTVRLAENVHSPTIVALPLR